MTQVRLDPAAASSRDVIANMLQFYVYDFTEWWAGEPRGELEEDGQFAAYDPLDSYWTDPTREPWLVRVDGFLAGFVLVNKVTHSGASADWHMAEFFIVRKHRRSGAGTAAAHAVFAAHPGQWELAIARTNLGAQSFWPRVVGGAPGVSEIDTFDVRDERWNGPILRFRIGG